MAEATNPITTASNPREDWSHLSPQEIVRRTRCDADDWVDIGAPATWRTCCDLILRRLKAASAPSPEAGAGGDLGEPSREAVEMMAEHLHEEEGNDLVWRWPEHADDDGYRGNGGYVTITPTDVQCRLREKARRVLIRADQIRAQGALAGEAAQAAETQSGSVHEHAAPQGATP